MSESLDAVLEPKEGTEPADFEVGVYTPPQPEHNEGESEPDKEELEAGEEAEAIKELEAMPTEEREEVTLGLKNMGYLLEEKKDRLFAKTIGFFADTNLDEEKLSSRWIAEMRESYLRSADAAHEKAAKAPETVLGSVKDTAVTAGKLTKWGRIISDLSSHHIASPWRYVMMVGATVARSGDAFKEAVLNDEEVADKTRIADPDEAYALAWDLYDKAATKGEVTSEALLETYVSGLPEDLMKRLLAEAPVPQTPEEKIRAAKNADLEPNIARKIAEGFVKWDMKKELGRLQKKLDDVDADSNLDPEARAAKRQNILSRMQSRLVDYDRIISDTGSVSMLALAGRWAKTAGQTAVAAATLETLTVGVEKLFEHFGSHAEAAAAIPAGGMRDALSHVGHGAGALGSQVSLDHLLHHDAIGADHEDGLEGGNIEAAHASDADLASGAHAEAVQTASSAAGSHAEAAHTATSSIGVHAEAAPASAAAPNAEVGAQTVETIHKGGSVTSAIDQMVKEGKITAAEAHLARNNPLSGGIAHGSRVGLDKLWLSHEGDQIKFVPGENGGAPHFEVVEGGGGHLGLESDLHPHVDAIHHAPEVPRVSGLEDHDSFYNGEIEGSGITPETDSLTTSIDAHANVVQAGEAVHDHLDTPQSLFSDKWTGTFKVSYDSAGQPTSMTFDSWIDNIKGTEFLKGHETFKNPTDQDMIFSYTRSLIPQMHVYERLSQDPARATEAGFLRDNIRNTFSAMQKAYGYKKFDISKIPPYAQDIFKHRGLLANIFDWQ